MLQEQQIQESIGGNLEKGQKHEYMFPVSVREIQY